MTAFKHDALSATASHSLSQYLATVDQIRRDVRRAIAGRLRKLSRQPQKLAFIVPAQNAYELADVLTEGFYAGLVAAPITSQDVTEWAQASRDACEALITTMESALTERANFDALMTAQIGK